MHIRNKLKEHVSPCTAAVLFLALTTACGTESEGRRSPSDRGGRTFKGITTERAKQNGWTSDVRSLSDNKILAILRKEDWNARASHYVWPLDLAVMNTEVNSWGVRAQKLLDLMKSSDVEGGPEAQAKWFVDQQTSFYNDIVARNPGQKVFLAGWLGLAAYMQDVIATRLSLTYGDASTNMLPQHTAKAYGEKE